MNIALINASPKKKGSTSKTLLEDLRTSLSEEAEITEYDFQTAAISRTLLEELSRADAWVFSLPLYVDGIPSHLLSCLVQIEQAQLNPPEVYVYGIVNLGFYEGIQAKPALNILENWCMKCGFVWGGGVGAGGGGGLSQMPATKTGTGPKGPIDNALKELADSILARDTQENRFVSIAFPRFLYQKGAQIGWRKMIRANGGSRKDLKNRPEL